MGRISYHGLCEAPIAVESSLLSSLIEMSPVIRRVRAPFGVLCPKLLERVRCSAPRHLLAHQRERYVGDTRRVRRGQLIRHGAYLRWEAIEALTRGLDLLAHVEKHDVHDGDLLRKTAEVRKVLIMAVKMLESGCADVVSLLRREETDGITLVRCEVC